MNLSNLIARALLDMLDESGSAEIRRNDFAEKIGCVPSQINYVLSSRFTPEQGYIVESRRGGGGSIKIRRISLDRPQMIMHAVNSIGAEIDERTCGAYLLNLFERGYISGDSVILIKAATNENNFRFLPGEVRDRLRANILKQMLLAST